MKHYQNLSLENLFEEVDGIIYTEQWKDIYGYEGLYQVSTFGRVKRLESFVCEGQLRERTVKERILRQSYIGRENSTTKYLKCQLSKDNIQKNIRIHKIVALAFIENPHDKPFPNHKEGIKWDNRATKLEWCTQSENEKHKYSNLGYSSHFKGKFGKDNPNSKKIEQCSINGVLIKEWYGARDIERELGFKNQGIYACCSGIQNTAYGYKWKYI